MLCWSWIGWFCLFSSLSGLVVDWWIFSLFTICNWRILPFIVMVHWRVLPFLAIGYWRVLSLILFIVYRGVFSLRIIGIYGWIFSLSVVCIHWWILALVASTGVALWFLSLFIFYCFAFRHIGILNLGFSFGFYSFALLWASYWLFILLLIDLALWIVGTQA